MIAVAVDPVRKNHFSFGFIGDAVPLGGHAADLKGAFFRSEQAAPRHRIEVFPINVALPHHPPLAIRLLYAFDRLPKTGRESCRDRGCHYVYFSVVAFALIKNSTKIISVHYSSNITIHHLTS